MRVLLDGLPIRGSNSLSVVVEHLLDAWVDLPAGDELHLALGADEPFGVPDGVVVHRVDLGSRHYLGRLRGQARDVPALARRLGADVVLGVLPSTVVVPLPCPRAAIVWDLRHELRKEQFSARARRLRTASYEIGYRQADALVTISGRTRDDLLASRPWLARTIVRPAPLGADHVDRWARGAAPERPYAITFGQWANKNVGLVVDAWERLVAAGEPLDLHVVGLGGEARTALQGQLEQRGLADRVVAHPWLDDEAFQRVFTASSLVVFPSDFEGFGLPAAEAMRLGLPLVITPEPALLEVTQGQAAVMDGWDADALVAAVGRAHAQTAEDRERAAQRAAQLTWASTAQATRDALAEAVAAASSR